MRLFDMLIGPSGCWLTLTYGLNHSMSDIDGVKSKFGLLSQYNPPASLAFLSS